MNLSGAFHTLHTINLDENKDLATLLTKDEIGPRADLKKTHYQQYFNPDVE